MIKTSTELSWPKEARLFYIVAKEGLFIGRNHEFFQSCVRASLGPSELESQASLLKPAFPLIPASLFEQVAGFFARVGELHSGEAIVFLVWDRAEQRVRLVVPRQTATVTRWWNGRQSPVGLRYTPPSDLPQHWAQFGDIHSHERMAAYCSRTDIEDETHSAGLHIVVGRIDLEPPDIHVEAAVDGARFRLAPESVIEGYDRRNEDVPAEWLERVEVEIVSSYLRPAPSASYAPISRDHPGADGSALTERDNFS